MSKLIKDVLTVGEDTVTLYELSALNRMEYLEYVFNAKNTLPVEASQDETVKAVTLLAIRDYGMLVALSLSQAPDENRDIAELMNEVLSEYGTGALTRAATMVRELSGMAVMERSDPEENKEPLSLEKS
ncbi:phage minor tail protein domain-containing protein [Klebsiella michiganensis]|uniref:phage minor tail protein domain-containing protein n=1 Tax=Klebsiella michiganensis TaxID=1134687 RepID=UPI003D8148A4